MKKNLVRKVLVLGIIVLFVVAGIIPSTVGIKKEKTQNQNVGNRGYIQGLIDNASDGDTIYIPSGIYYENIVINKPISLIGEDKNTTIIDCSGYEANVIMVTADWVNISGFTIQNSTNFYYYGNGIIINSNHTNIIDNNIFNNINGITLKSSSSNNIISNIISNEYNGVMLWNNSNGNNIIYNKIWNNSNYGIFSRYNCSGNNIIGNNINNNGHGIILESSSGNNITSNIITNNGFCGICFGWSSNNNIKDNNITNNTNFGINIYGLGNNIIGNTISNNGVIGISLTDSTNNNITSNLITSNYEEGIHLFHSHNNTIEHNAISSNKVYGIILDASNKNIIQKNNFIDNGKDIALDSYPDEKIFELLFNRNRLIQNYWNRPRLLPKVILGILWIPIPGIWMWGQPHIPFPWINIDWHPALKPYDI